MSEVLEEGSTEKPRTGSLFKTMSLETITLEEALRLLSLPRTLERAGRRGDPGRERPLRPVHQEGQGDPLSRGRGAAFTVTTDEALALLAQPKERRGRGQAKPPLKDSARSRSGKPIVVKEGRFGPYVTDGETNASLRRGDAGGADDGAGARAAGRTPRQRPDAEEARRVTGRR